MSVDEYQELQEALVNRPDMGAIIQGTGGLRKVRWKQEGRGKSGGVRAIHFTEYYFMAMHTIEYIPPMTGAASFKQHYYYLKCAADFFDISAVLDLSTSVIQLHCPHGIDTLFPQFSRTNA